MQTQDTKDRLTGKSQKLQAGLGELAGLREQIRMKVHLAGMDARDAFHKIEPAIDEAEREVNHLAHQAVVAVQEAERQVKGVTEDAADALAKKLESLAASLRKIRSGMPK